MRRLYLLLAVVGFILPYYFFVSFLLANGFDLVLMLNQLFVNQIMTFFVVDLILTAITSLVYAYFESKRLSMPNLWLVVSTLFVGPSFAFPLFLFFREKRLVQAI